MDDTPIFGRPTKGRQLICEGCRRLADVVDENELLRAALKPLTDLPMTDSLDGHMPDSAPYISWARLTYGDIRRARCVLEQRGNEK